MKFKIQITLLASLFLNIGHCNAESFIYSFEGVISTIFHDAAGIIANEGYEIGDYVRASFQVDFQQDGYFILNNGTVVIPEDPAMTNNTFWYFFSSLIDGTRLPEVNGGMHNEPETINEYHIGYLNSSPTGNSGVLQGGISDSSISIIKNSNLDAKVQNWIIGEELKGVIVGYSDTGSSIIWADLELKEIKHIATPIQGAFPWGLFFPAIMANANRE